MSPISSHNTVPLFGKATCSHYKESHFKCDTAKHSANLLIKRIIQAWLGGSLWKPGVLECALSEGS